MRLYISGPMEGIVDLNFPAFMEAEALLREKGYEVLNPARHGKGNEGKAYYMRRAFHDVLAADGLALLPGWGTSVGARAEVTVAESLNLDVRVIVDWLDDA